jgi:3'-phosphoadenosine 5'-phosphosulfate (PAPS) 3'-phosphatase
MPSDRIVIDHDDFDLACDVIQDATNLALAARATLPPEAIVQKPDGSVVTAVDVALQVLILSRLEQVFGVVPTIAEEDRHSIGGKPAAEAHCRRLLADWGFEGGEAGIERALASGGFDGPTSEVDYTWVLDPIDGTQGFVDGDHWCPCLALLRRGEVVFASNGHPTVLGGMLLSAAKGAGAWWFPLAGGECSRAEVSQQPLAPGETVRVVAPARATASQVRARTAIGEVTGHPCTLVHSDSQAKYAHVIAGAADIAFSRRGAGPGKYLWDHAGAILLAREAGAWVGDTDGRDIDLSRGRRLDASRAVICTARGLGPTIARELARRDVAEGYVSRDSGGEGSVSSRGDA